MKNITDVICSECVTTRIILKTGSLLLVMTIWRSVEKCPEGVSVGLSDIAVRAVHDKEIFLRISEK